MLREGLGVACDLLGKNQTLLGVAADHLMFGNVQRHLHPQLLALKGDNFVLEQEVPPAVLILLVPDVEIVPLQHGIGAEGAGLVQALERLVALPAPVVPQAHQALSGRVDVVQLIGVHVADVEDVVLRLQNHLGQLVLRPVDGGGDVRDVELAAVGVLPLHPLLVAGAVRLEIPLLQLLRRAGLGEEEALKQRGMELLQSRQLVLGLHTLAAHPDLAAVRQLQHVAQQAVVVHTVLDIVDKAAVDLDLVNLQLLQPPQAGVAGAEVVH